MNRVTSLPYLVRASRNRLYSTTPLPSSLKIEALDSWIVSEKKLVTSATLSSEHLSDLYITLPTRDGSKTPYVPPKKGSPLEYGHHLAFFHPRNAESVLRSDGTDADFCPPKPFTRRMWAGGKVEWRSPLIIGDKVNAMSTIGLVEKKGFEKGSPMVFVKQMVAYSRCGSKEVAIEEERSHVYLSALGNTRKVREVSDLPVPDFSFSYLPSPTTLFRFSALTFNGHYIHLDKDYAYTEGYSERLVHGPLTALMLLEIVKFHKRDAVFKSFEYRARNPLVVNQPITIYGAWENGTSVHVWAVSENGVVGMTGKISL